MIHIRPAVSDDAPALLDIYAPYVIETAITFEYEVPTLDDFRQRIKNTLHTHPYLVMERDGEIVGYAYTGQLGTRLYHALEDASRAQNVQVLYACIAAPVSDGDPHLTRASIDFHTRRGYEIVGTFHRCGYKFDTWYDVVWMEKRLSDAAIPPAVVPFSSFVK